MPLRKYNHVAFVEPHGRILGADDAGPALAARDHVIFEHALRAGQHERRELPRRRRLRGPRSARAHVEENRAGQAHGPQHVGNNIGAWIH